MTENESNLLHTNKCTSMHLIKHDCFIAMDHITINRWNTFSDNRITKCRF